MSPGARFEWDEDKNIENETKHGVSFYLAQRAFLDPDRVIVEDKTHSFREDRHFSLAQAFTPADQGENIIYSNDPL